WYELAALESKTDKIAAAEAYQKAIAIQPNFAPLRRDFGMLEFEQSNYAVAAIHLSRAVELGINEASTYNFLGISFSHTRQPQKAIKSYRQAIAIDPKLAEAHLNLAYLYQQLKQVKQARQEYEEACNLQANFCQFV